VRPGENTPYYDDEAITYEFLRSYVTENAQGASTWSGITDKPAWTDKLSYENNIDPENPSNYDIVVSESIIPAGLYSIGRENIRFVYGYFQRVRVSESPYDDDEAVPLQFMREYVAANAMWSEWSGIRGRPDWTNTFSGDTTTVSVGSNLVPNASHHTIGSVSLPWRHIYSLSLTVKSQAYFSGSRIRDVGAPISDTDAATKKYVDDTETDTRSYVDAQKLDLLTQINVLSTQAGHIISILAAEMSEEEIPFRVIYSEDNNSKMLTVGQARALHFIFPASLQNYTDLITEVKLTFSCRKTTGFMFLRGRSTTTLGFDMTGTELTVNESFPAFGLSTGPLDEILNVKVTLRVTIASNIFTVASTTVKVRDRLEQDFTMFM
jgi:hypothetical protein